MIKILPLLLIISPLAFANKAVSIPPYMALIGFLTVVGFFFWGIYKAIKTQKIIYALALLPFILLIIWMFFI